MVGMLGGIAGGGVEEEDDEVGDEEDDGSGSVCLEVVAVDDED